MTELNHAVRRWLGRPVDASSLAAFRILFGLVACYGTARFLWNGWVDDFYVRPAFHFKYWGFAWVEPWSRTGLHVHHAVVAVAAALVALGLFYRVAIVVFFLGFAYLELLDVTTYLNHYYLQSLLALLLCFLPANAAFSLDARLFPRVRRTHVPQLCLTLLRFQVGVVYVFAGLAKLGSDWLLSAQPLSIWLSARTDTPVIGALFERSWAAYAMSWAGFLFDTSVVLFLSIRRTRPWAFAAVIAFHALTRMLFPIGMFPFIMVTSALIFFPADWPRRLLRLERAPAPAAGAPAPTWLCAAFAVYALLQVGIPLRSYLYGGDVRWHEQGMRWSWRVMVREKNGAVEYVVKTRDRTFHENPRRWLTEVQAREFSAQPDLILQLAHRIARDYRERGFADVRVFAETRVSLNGRPGVPLVDPAVDLARVEDGLARARWITPAPAGAPLYAGALR